MQISLLFGKSTDNTDLVNIDLKVTLSDAIDILNEYNHNYFNTWHYDSNLELIVPDTDALLRDSYYYTLKPSEVILIAKHYKGN